MPKTMNTSDLFLEQKSQLSQLRVTGSAELLSAPREEVVKRMAAEAIRAYDFGYSYRNFRVGAAALYSTDNGLWIEHAANFKSGKECEYDRHSEQELLSTMQILEAITCNVLAVAGDIQVDQHSGKETRTLHPCGWCRDAITRSPLITEKTIIVTTRPDLSVVEYGSRDEYLEFHSSGSDTLTLFVAEE